MTTVFVICAAIGCTVLVFQFVLTMIGLGGEAFDLDISSDVDADIGMDLDVDIDHGHTDSTWLFGVISFRTVIAALAFFGLAGLTAQSADVSTPYAILIAAGAGFAAMYGVYRLMRLIYSLQSEGTARIGRAVGREATVYVTIPAENSGSGKIQINLQNRTMEYLALSPGHELPPGSKVVVTNVITSDTVEVEPITE